MEIRLHPSRTYCYIALLSIAGSEVSIFYSSLPVFLRWTFMFIVLGYGGCVLWKDILLRSERSVESLFCSDDNSWQLKARFQPPYPATLTADSLVTAGFCLLRFKVPQQKGRRSCVIFWDALPPDYYRQLLMKLKTIKVKKNEDAII